MSQVIKSDYCHIIPICKFDVRDLRILGKVRAIKLSIPTKVNSATSGNPTKIIVTGIGRMPACQSTEHQVPNV